MSSDGSKVSSDESKMYSEGKSDVEVPKSGGRTKLFALVGAVVAILAGSGGETVAGTMRFATPSGNVGVRRASQGAKVREPGAPTIVPEGNNPLTYPLLTWSAQALRAWRRRGKRQKWKGHKPKTKTKREVRKTKTKKALGHKPKTKTKRKVRKTKTNALKVASYNVLVNLESGKAPSNQATRKFFANCQTLSRDRSGRRCGTNAADFMNRLEIDVIGIQETMSHRHPFLVQLQRHNYKFHHEAPGQNLTAVAWRQSAESYLGAPTLLKGVGWNVIKALRQTSAPKFKRDCRGASAVVFPKAGVLFISVWFNHHINLNRVMRTVLNVAISEANRAKVGASIKRVVVTGDTNDHGPKTKTKPNQTNDTSFARDTFPVKLSGGWQELKLSNGLAGQKTCCNPLGGHKLGGDHIWTSGDATLTNKDEDAEKCDLKQANGKKREMSDHDAVCQKIYFK